MLQLIVICELDTSVNAESYINQRAIISSIFSEDYSFGSILLRLTVIDSMYSTNAGYSYFSFEEMSEKIMSLGSRSDARNYFYNIALGGDDPYEVFSEPYGIQKNLSEGSKQMSLMSKYAYYELLQDKNSYHLGFPIYDRLAKQAYPTVCKMLGYSSCYSLPDAGTPSVTEYIAAISQLRSELFEDNNLYRGYQQYDILDAYLWRMGKFEEGNLSLLLGRKDYVTFIENIGLAAPKIDSTTDKRKETDEYKTAIFEEYRQYCNPEAKELDFNKLIVWKLLNTKEPFKNTSNKEYLEALLNHWIVFRECKQKK